MKRISSGSLKAADIFSPGIRICAVDRCNHRNRKLFLGLSDQVKIPVYVIVLADLLKVRNSIGMRQILFVLIKLLLDLACYLLLENGFQDNGPGTGFLTSDKAVDVCRERT